MNFYSQFGEDRWLFENIFGPAKAGTPSGTFCEVGAFDGVMLSNTLAFHEMGWRGICVEPDPAVAAVCIMQRDDENCQTWCCAAGLATHGRFRVNLRDRALSGLQAAEYGPMQEIVVVIRRLDWLLTVSGIEELDLLSVDTEGTELEVWESIGTIRPRAVVMEHLTGAAPSRAREITERLARDGYRMVHTTQCNLILVRDGRDGRDQR